MNGLVLAHASVYRQLGALADVWASNRSTCLTDPDGALLLADTLDVQLGAVITKVALLRHEARRVIEERKAAR